MIASRKDNNIKRIWTDIVAFIKHPLCWYQGRSQATAREFTCFLCSGISRSSLWHNKGSPESSAFFTCLDLMKLVPRIEDITVSRRSQTMEPNPIIQIPGKAVCKVELKIWASMYGVLCGTRVSVDWCNGFWFKKLLCGYNPTVHEQSPFWYSLQSILGDQTTCIITPYLYIETPQNCSCVQWHSEHLWTTQLNVNNGFAVHSWKS